MKGKGETAEHVKEITWRQTLEAARLRPSLYLGGPEDRLIRTTIRGPATLLFDTKAFLDVRSADIYASAGQYVCSFESGPLRPEIASLLEWAKLDVLISSFGKVWPEVRALTHRWTAPFQSNVNHFHEAVSALQVATLGIVGVRTGQGLYWQIYQEGWPLTPPVLSVAGFPTTGFFVGGSITKNWFDQLPFTKALVASGIPMEHEHVVRVHWSSTERELPDQSVPLIRNDETLKKWMSWAVPGKT